MAHRGGIVKALFAADMHENQSVDPVAARTSEFIVSSLLDRRGRFELTKSGKMKKIPSK